MEETTASLLPYVLDMLSQEPDLCTSIDEMVLRMQDLIVDDAIYPFGCIKRAVEFAVNLGTNLGLLTVNDRRVKVPFNFRAKCNQMQAANCAQKLNKRNLEPKRAPSAPIRHVAQSLLDTDTDTDTDVPIMRPRPRQRAVRAKCVAKRPKANKKRMTATKRKLQNDRRIRKYAKKRNTRK